MRFICMIREKILKEYAEETTWHLVKTKDFVNLEYKGEAIKRGGEKDPNYNIYTGVCYKGQGRNISMRFTRHITVV